MMDTRRIANLEADVQRLKGQLSEIPVRFPSPGSKGVGSEIQQFVFKSQQANWITCRTWDGLAEGANDVLVAKPWELRPYVFSGRTYQPGSDSTIRVKYTYPTNDRRELVTEKQTNGEFSEQSRATESVYPPWDLTTIGAERGLIYAFKPVGGTSEEDGDNNPIVWQDANVSARTWRGAAASGLGVIVGTAYRLENDTIIIKTTTGQVTVAKFHLHRLSYAQEGQGNFRIVYTERNPSNSSRKATRAADLIFQNEQLIPAPLSEFNHEGEVGDTIIALDVGETVTGITGVRYLDITPRIWGRMP